MNKQKEERQPLYLRNPILSIALAIGGTIAAISPLLFAFGILDSWFDIDNWRLFYTVISIFSFLIFGLGVVLTIGSINLEIQEVCEKYKNVATRLKHLQWNMLLFALFIGAGITLLYVFMIGLPLWKDSRVDLLSHSGECSVWRRFGRSGSAQYIVFELESGNELKLSISKNMYSTLKGEESEKRGYECNYEAEVFYSPNFKKVISVRGVSRISEDNL